MMWMLKMLRCILRFDNIVYVLLLVKTVTELKKLLKSKMLM